MADSLPTVRLDAVVPHGHAEAPELVGRVWKAPHVASEVAAHRFSATPVVDDYRDAHGRVLAAR